MPASNQSVAARGPKATALSLMLILLFAGCTSDVPNPVGSGIPGELQLNDLSTVVVTNAVTAGHVVLEDEDLPYDQNQVLYFGNQDGESSAILARYDFSALRDSVGADVVISADTVSDVTLRLFRLKYYGAVEEEEETKQTPQKTFEVYALDDTLDVAQYPGEEPAYTEFLASKLDSGASIFIELASETFVGWFNEGNKGIIIREGAASEPGFIGYASMDMHGGGYQEIELEQEETLVGPTITVTVQDTLGPFVFKPVADVSTLYPTDDVSDDLVDDVVVRSHLRVSPYFSFDLADLPGDIFVNRAVVRLGANSDESYGQIQSLVIHEVPLSLVDGRQSILLSDLDDQGQQVFGQHAVDMEGLAAGGVDWVGFDVTYTVQRILNGVIDTDTAFMVSLGESFTSYIMTINYKPDFYLSRYVFHGTGHPDLAPHLEITYTPFSGGSQ